MREDLPLAVAAFDRIMARGGIRRGPEWEMNFPGFVYRLWRISDVDVEDAGCKWAWEARHGKERVVVAADSRNHAEMRLRDRIMRDLGPLVTGLGRFLQEDRDWCYACGKTLDLPSHA